MSGLKAHCLIFNCHLSFRSSMSIFSRIVQFATVAVSGAQGLSRVAGFRNPR